MQQLFYILARQLIQWGKGFGF